MNKIAVIQVGVILYQGKDHCWRLLEKGILQFFVNDKWVNVLDLGDLNNTCEYCLGTGYITTPAYQNGGEIVDESKTKCVCKDNS